VDSLQNVRKLKEHGVEIYFEKENIWTFDSRGELLITIMSSLAQEESRSISENTTWGKRKQFAEGKTSVGYSAFLGYDKDFKINEEQAQVVKHIYKLFLGGRSFYAITKELEKRGLKSPSGKDKWYISTVRSILTNEKYRGDALIQKEYTADFLDKTRRKNTGEIAVLCGGTSRGDYSAGLVRLCAIGDKTQRAERQAQRREHLREQNQMRLLRRLVRSEGMALDQQIPQSHLSLQQEIRPQGQAVQHTAFDGRGNQTNFRQGTEFLGGSQREGDCGTPIPD